MWDKSFRLVLISAIYRDLFWKELEDYKVKIDFDFILESWVRDHGVEVDKKEIAKYFELYLEKEDDFVNFLKKYLNNWSHTYKVVRAILFTFLIEKELVEKNSGDARGLVGKYIRTAQDLVGGKSTALVHAVLSKIIEQEYGPRIKKESGDDESKSEPEKEKK